MPYGVKNAPSHFQMAMTNLLKGLHWKILLVYVDDILIYSHNFDDHLQHLGLVFHRIRDANLKLQPNTHHAIRKSI